MRANIVVEISKPVNQVDIGHPERICPRVAQVALTMQLYSPTCTWSDSGTLEEMLEKLGGVLSHRASPHNDASVVGGTGSAKHRYMVILNNWHLVIDAESEAQACVIATEELKTKLRPEYLLAHEAPLSHRVPPSREEAERQGSDR